MTEDGMDCREARQLIERRLRGPLPPAVEARLQAHAASCPDCATLLAGAATVRRELAGAGRRLTRAVLARTTGPACARAQSLLPQLVEGSLPAPEAELVRGHLAGCPACSSLRRTLAWVTAELPRLGEVAVPAGFTAAVLARTSRAARPAAGLVAVPGPRPAAAPGGPAGRRWQRLLLRPRFALEFAYAALLALLLLTATPISPLPRAPGQALEVVQAGPGAILPGLDEPIARAGAWVGDQARLAWQATWTAGADRVATGASAGLQELWRRGHASGPVLRDLGADAGAVASALIHLEVVESYSRLSSARQDLRRLWRIWTRRSS